MNISSGTIGPRGDKGPVGFIGAEGGYCPCPKELQKLISQLRSTSSTLVQGPTVKPAPLIGSPPAYQSPGAPGNAARSAGNWQLFAGGAPPGNDRSFSRNFGAPGF